MSSVFAGELAEKRREMRSVAIFRDSPLAGVPHTAGGRAWLGSEVGRRQRCSALGLGPWIGAREVVDFPAFQSTAAAAGSVQAWNWSGWQRTYLLSRSAAACVTE
jgi:hypothetical protein